MDAKGFANKLKGVVTKYKYAAIILVIGLCLLMLPEKETKEDIGQITQKPVSKTIEADALSEILQSVNGAGKVQVLLSVASGERTIYQTDTNTSSSGDNNSTQTQTIVITDSQRTETGLIAQVNPPTYLGAIVVCEGADSATVRLAVTQAVAKITGLGADSICVLKMK